VIENKLHLSPYTLDIVGLFEEELDHLRHQWLLQLSLEQWHRVDDGMCRLNRVLLSRGRLCRCRGVWTLPGLLSGRAGSNILDKICTKPRLACFHPRWGMERHLQTCSYGRISEERLLIERVLERIGGSGTEDPRCLWLCLEIAMAIWVWFSVEGVGGK